MPIATGGAATAQYSAALFLPDAQGYPLPIVFSVSSDRYERLLPNCLLA
jgi:hypothetical protein